MPVGFKNVQVTQDHKARARAETQAQPAGHQADMMRWVPAQGVRRTVTANIGRRYSNG